MNSTAFPCHQGCVAPYGTAGPICQEQRLEIRSQMVPSLKKTSWPLSVEMITSDLSTPKVSIISLYWVDNYSGCGFAFAARHSTAFITIQAIILRNN